MTDAEGRPRERCQHCGFDSELYDRADTVSSHPIVPAVIAAAVEGLDEQVMGWRPDPRTRSIAEYVDHVGDVVAANRAAIETAIESPGTDLGDPEVTGISAEVRAVDIAAALARVEREYDTTRTLLRDLADDQWNLAVTLGGEPRTVDWFARHVVHDGLHHLAAIGRIRHGFGLGAPTQRGTVVQLSVSAGGVPKQSVDHAGVTATGLTGDVQADRRHHGRPVQAVCLWSADVIDALRGQGHPIAAGNAGENITVAGVDWATLRPGSRLDVGSVPLLVTAHAIPCSKNAQWFADRDFNHIRHSRHPGRSRLYAIPLGAGDIGVGDAVVVEP